jgi:hypothetical protein
MSCNCMICQECGGVGYILSWSARVRNPTHLIDCENCRGTGKITLCFDCNAELDREEQPNERIN